MKLLAKFNLILMLTFSIGLILSGLYSYKLTEDNALTQVTDQAELIMQQALAVRSYSVEEVRPLAKTGESAVFHPQTVPAYAATQVANIVRENRPDYIYKEAVFNPTNPRDKASPQEEKIINKFISNPELEKQVGVINAEDSNEQSLYVAYPIRIKNSACLACHSTPENAPAAMLDIYGKENGFGWKLNETVGTQLVSVPFTLPAELAKKTFNNFLLSLFLIFASIFVILNIMIRKFIIQPVSDLTNLADELSKGKTDIEELNIKGNDEIASLSASFNRMRRSVIKLLELVKSKSS